MSDAAEKEQAFTLLYQTVVEQDAGKVIEYALPYPKHEFLDWVVQEKDVLLHGSCEQGIQILEMNQANCQSKEFGNLEAVYATSDPILPIFYAIRDVQGVGFRYRVISGVTRRFDSSGKEERTYNFKLHPIDLASKPWAAGAVYLLPKHTFKQGTNDKGQLIEEWVSMVPVVPLAELRVEPSDFPYFDRIRSYGA